MKKLSLATILVVGVALSLGLSACKQKVARENQRLGASPSATNSVQSAIEAQTQNYHVLVHIPNPPLKTQAQAYTLQLHDLKANKPVEAVPGVKVEMPMGNTPMIAPTTVSKGAKLGEFQVDTEFTMAGDWRLEVHPAQASETITLPLSVQ